MRHVLLLIGCVALFIASNAGAEVVDSSASGFLLRYEAVVPAPPAAVYSALVRRVGRWWDSDHTYSGDARNLSIDVAPGGCFCERLPEGGGVRHLTVVYAAFGKRLVMVGGLGPLQEAGVAGSMNWVFTAAERGTKVQMTYSVGGYYPGGLASIAKPVDSVLGGQFARFVRFVETGRPN